MTSIPDTPNEAEALVDDFAMGTDRLMTFLGALAFMTATSMPMAFFYYIFPPMLRDLGYSPEVVGGFAVVYLPYVLRGLWAFAIERVMRGRAARYRMGTMVLALLSIVAVLTLMLLDPAKDVGAIMAVAVLIFVLLASGMTTVDGYLLARLSSEDRARSAAWSAGGVAMGGICVGLMAWFDVFTGSWTNAVTLLALAMLVPSLLILLLPARRTDAVATQQNQPREKRVFRSFLANPRLRALMLMAVLAHGGIGLISGYLPILQVDAGLKIGEIGLFSAAASNVLGLIGAMVGGVIVARIGGWRSLTFVMIYLGVVLLVSASLHQAIWGRGFAIGLTGALMFAGYVYYVPFRALILQACDGPHAVSRVAILSSFDMTISIVGMSLAGVVAVQLGLTLFFAACGGLALIAATLSFKNAARADLTPQSNS
ncbi:MAG: MFS transporter [Pseudomonadota bacterium]